MGEEKTQYGGDVVMLLLNKIIKNVGLAHGFYAHGFKPCTWFMVLKPYAKPSKQPIVLFYMV